MDDKLLSCPFCGGKAKMLPAAFENEVIAAKYANCVGIRCTKCGISTLPLSKEEAIKMWNTIAIIIGADLAGKE